MTNSHWIDVNYDKSSSTVLKIYLKIWHHCLHPPDVSKGHCPIKNMFTPFLSTGIFSVKIPFITP